MSLFSNMNSLPRAAWGKSHKLGAYTIETCWLMVLEVRSSRSRCSRIRCLWWSNGWDATLPLQGTDSLEKTLMLGKNEGRRRRGQQRMRWLDGITDAMDSGVWASSGNWWWTGKPNVISGWGISTNCIVAKSNNNNNKSCEGWKGESVSSLSPWLVDGHLFPVSVHFVFPLRLSISPSSSFFFFFVGRT